MPQMFYRNTVKASKYLFKVHLIGRQGGFLDSHLGKVQSLFLEKIFPQSALYFPSLLVCMNHWFGKSFLTISALFSFSAHFHQSLVYKFEKKFNN